MHFKSEMGIFSGYIYFLFIFFTKNIYLNYTDVGAGRASGRGEEGIQIYEPDVLQGVRRGQKNDKISILWVFLELLGLQNFSCLSKPTMNTCKTISGHTSSID